MTRLQDHNKWLMPAALVVIAVSIIHLFRDTTPSEFQESKDVYTEVRALQVLRVAEHLPPGAPVGLLVFQSELESPEIKRIVRQLKKAGMEVQHVEGVGSTGEGGQGFPYEEYCRVAEEHPDLKALISLCGTPSRPKTETLPDPASLPPLLVTGELEVPARLRRMLYHGRVAAALVPRKDPSMEPTTTPAELLDRDYEMLHARSR